MFNIILHSGLQYLLYDMLFLCDINYCFREMKKLSTTFSNEYCFGQCYSSGFKKNIIYYSFFDVSHKIYLYDMETNTILANPFEFNKRSYRLDDAASPCTSVNDTNTGNIIIYLIGGYSKSTNSIPVRDTWIYTSKTDIWIMGPFINVGRAEFSCNFVDDRIYIFGGHRDGFLGPRTSIIEKLVENVWKRLDPVFLEKAVSYHRSIVVPDINRIYIIGGSLAHQGGNIGDLWVYTDVIQEFNYKDDTITVYSESLNRELAGVLAVYDPINYKIQVCGGEIGGTLGGTAETISSCQSINIWTTSPTNNPSNIPTNSPTNNPTMTPTSTPSDSPSISPTNHPSIAPTENPSNIPTITPARSPTDSPSILPTNYPSIAPTATPTKNPSGIPTMNKTTYIAFNETSTINISASIITTQNTSNFNNNNNSLKKKVNPLPFIVVSVIAFVVIILLVLFIRSYQNMKQNLHIHQMEKYSTEPRMNVSPSEYDGVYSSKYTTPKSPNENINKNSSNNNIQLSHHITPGNITNAATHINGEGFMSQDNIPSNRHQNSLNKTSTIEDNNTDITQGFNQNEAAYITPQGLMKSDNIDV